MYNNLIDLSTTILTPSSQANGYPVTLIRDTLRKRAWRATGYVQEQVIVRPVSGQIVAALAISGHNLSLTATVELWKSTDNVTYTSVGQINIASATSTGYGEGFYGYGGYGGTDLSGVLPGATQVLFFDPVSTSSYPYWKIIFKDNNNADFYIKCGRIFLGNYWEPAHQIVPGWRIEVADETEITTLISQQKINNEKDIFLRVIFTLPHLSDSDAFDTFLDIIRTYDITKRDAFLSLFPRGSQFLQDVTTVYGRFIGPEIGIAHVSSWTFTTGELTFEESL